MKTSLLTALITGMFLVSTASSCLQGKLITGSKNYITKEVKTEPFNEIKSVGSMNITYYQDSSRRIEIYGSDNVVPLVETTVKDGTLTVKLKKNVSIRNGKLSLKVFSPELNKLTITGSGDIEFANGIQTSENVEISIFGSGDIQGKGFKCKKMGVSISGSGDVKLEQIESQECNASIAGSGDVSLNGKATNAKYSIAGSGDIRASELQAENVATSIAGSGDISCYASNKLAARVSGSGDIYYKGNPREVDASKKHIHKID